MERLASYDFRRLSEFLQGLYAARDLDGFVAYTLAHLPKLVASDVTVYAELNLPRRRHMMIGAPINIFTPGTWRCSPATRTSTHSSSIRGAGAMGAPSKSPISSHAASFVAGHSGTSRFGRTASTARCWSGFPVRRASRSTLGSTGPAMISRRPSDSSSISSARTWFRPTETLRFLRCSVAPPAPPARRASCWGQTLERHGGRLTVHLFRGPAQRLLVFEEETAAPDPKILTRLGISRREAEVLAWVAQGKTNHETATILGLSARTVAKHLERMYPRLGVENRTAAAARAIEVLRASRES